MNTETTSHAWRDDADSYSITSAEQPPMGPAQIVQSTRRWARRALHERQPPAPAAQAQVVGASSAALETLERPRIWQRSIVVAAKTSLEPLAEWEGYVEDIGDEIFEAYLIAVRNVADDVYTSAEFPLDELSDDDRANIKIGAVFRWVIGYLRTTGGTKTRVSRIVFRRMPAWSEREIKTAVEAAQKLHNELRFE